VLRISPDAVRRSALSRGGKTGGSRRRKVSHQFAPCWRGRLRVVQLKDAKLLPSGPITRTSRARIFPLTRICEAGEELRGEKGATQATLSVGADSECASKLSSG